MGTTARHHWSSFAPILLSLLKALPEEPERFGDTIDTLVNSAAADRWQDFVSFASYHGVLGVIDSELTGTSRVSQQVRETSERRRVIEELWHAHLVRGLETAVAILADARIRTCALKGPVLAARLYPKPTARHCLDVDLLVRPEDVERALEAFTTAGYAADTGVAATYLLTYGHHVNVARPGMAPIELHFRAYAGFGVELPAGLILTGATPFQLREGLSVLVPSPEDEFVYLAAHAAGHSFIRLVWLYDLKLLLRRYPAIQWDRVADRAETFGVATVVAYTIRLLESWLGVVIHDVPERLRRRGVRGRIADRLLTEVSTPQPRSLRDNLGGLLFTSALCDSVRASAWLLQHHILRTTRRRLHRLAPVYLPDRWSA